MVDLFLLAVLASVGQLGALAGVMAEPGCLMFAAVVVCTLLAAEIYQPRLIWLSPKIPAS
jgi:paraquat-inducible protein A